MMAMPVMQVRPVGVGVHNRFVPVRVHMRLLRRQVRVIVRMVGVVVPVRVLVLDRSVGVPVRMPLHGEQPDRGREQRA
jgi:hypothetical protein